MKTLLNCQRSKHNNVAPIFLPVQAGILSPYLKISRKEEIGTSRNISSFLLNMKLVIYEFFDIYGGSDHIGVSYGIIDPSTDLVVGGGGVNVPWSSIFAAGNSIYDVAIPLLIADALVQGYTVTLADFIGSGLLMTMRTFNSPSLAINTARQASTTRDALVVASVEIDAALSLVTGAKGTVTLQYADNSAFTLGVKTASIGVNGNTGSLSLGINTVGSGSGPVVGIIPAGKWYRLATANVTGTPTYGTPVIQEILI